MSSNYKITQVTDQDIIDREIQKLYHSKWKKGYYKTIHFLHCSRRIYCIWFVSALLLCLLYALILYFSLIGIRAFIPADNNLPFFHVPKVYNITLKFDGDYSRNTLKFSGQTRILFESTVVTPNFFINVGENINIKQLYFEHYPQGDSFNSIKTGFDSETQMQGYVINHVFEETGQYVAVFDFDGQIFPANSDKSRPFRIVNNVRNNDTDSYAIIHACQENASLGLRYITPSFDSNNYPSKFNLKLQHGIGFQSVSNMKLEESINFTDNLIQRSFEESIALLPTQLSFSIHQLTSVTKINCQRNREISIHYQSNIVEKIEPNRLLQLTAESGEYSDAIQKIDGVILPGIDQRSSPGIIFLNQDESIIAAEGLSDKIQLQDSC